MGLIRPKIQFPDKAQVLFKPAPYKIFFGGRGATKTWDFARASLLLGANRKLFILHTREIQKSIKESVHKLLSDQIEPMGLTGIYEVQDTEIVNVTNGTRHVFAGMRNNIHTIKSMEAIDLAIVYEATFISTRSWEIFLPTVRRDPPYGPFGEGSEVWVEFNPELKTDTTYHEFVVDPPAPAFHVKTEDDAHKFIRSGEPVESVVVEVNWRDNPWFPETLRKQKDRMRKRNHDSYLTVWEGKTRVALQGAIYAKEYAAAMTEGRITPNLKLIRGKPVTVAFDLGRSDMCCFWVIQQVGTEHHVVDFYGDTGYGMDHYLEELQSRKLIVRKIILPADASSKMQSATRRGVTNTIEREVREAYPGPGVVQVLPPQPSKVIGINATRLLWPRLYFNEIDCADGLMALQHYQYGIHPVTQQRTKEPLHNWASNPADSLRYYSVSLQESAGPIRKPHVLEDGYGGFDMSDQAWMGQ